MAQPAEILKTSKVLFLSDERLSRDRAQIVARTINRLRSLCHLEVIQKNGVTEDQIIEHTLKTRPNLLLLPWHKALQWTKLDGQLGAQRLRAPVIAGYLGEPISVEQLEIPSNRTRMTFIDTHRTGPEEMIPWILSLAHDGLRGGSSAIHALVDPPRPVPTHWEDRWPAGESAGTFLDRLLAHPDLEPMGWSSRRQQLRSLAIALWTLIHEEGPGAGELSQIQASAAKSEVAKLHLGVSTSLLTLRLVWSLPVWNSRDVLESWWRRPNHLSPDTPAIVAANCDILRIQHHADASRIELVAGFLPSAPSMSAPQELRTLIIEPLEDRFSGEGQGALMPPALQPLAGSQKSNPSAPNRPATDGLSAPHQEIEALKKLLAERDRTLERMREGGVGENTQPALRAPDLESLIGAVRDRIEDSLLQIRDLHRSLKEAKYRGLKPEEIMKVRTRLRSLQLRHKTWVTELNELSRRFDRAIIDEVSNEKGEAA